MTRKVTESQMGIPDTVGRTCVTDQEESVTLPDTLSNFLVNNQENRTVMNIKTTFSRMDLQWPR